MTRVASDRRDTLLQGPLARRSPRMVLGADFALDGRVADILRAELDQGGHVRVVLLLPPGLGLVRRRHTGGQSPPPGRCGTQEQAGGTGAHRGCAAPAGHRLALPRGSARGRSRLPGVSARDEIDEFAERDTGFQIVAEVGVADNLIAVAATDLLLPQVPLTHQIADDLLHRALSDPDYRRNITHPGFSVQSQRDQDVPMVGQEHPVRVIHRKQTTRVQIRENQRRGSSQWEFRGAGLDRGLYTIGRRQRDERC